MGKRENWLLCLVCLRGGSWLLCDYSSQCHGLVCSLWVWYSLTIFWCQSCEQRWLWRVYTFAWSLSQFKILMWWLKWRLNAILCEQRRIWRVCTFAQALLSLRHCTNLLYCLIWQFVCYSRQQRILWWVCTFAQAVTGQCYKYQDLLCWQQRLLGVCTFAQAPLSLLHSIEISCASWNGDFCNVYDVVSLHQQPQDFCAAICALYQWFKKCSQCVVLKFLNKTFASLPRKNKQSSNRFFWMLFHGNMTTAALRHADFPQFMQLHQKKAPVTANSRTLLDLQSKPWIKSPIAWQCHKLQCYRWSVRQVSSQIK